MADEWNPAISYSPGSTATYRGFSYVRSSYPSSATGGTPPNEEMSTDSKGVAIRTWTLEIPPTATASANLTAYYFRLIEPTFNSTSPTPEFSYSGAQFIEASAYGSFGDLGYTVEWDQFKSNTSPTPDSPVCPAELCGVALQGIVGSVALDVVSFADSSIPRKYHIYITFNHPLYFRRTITVITRIIRTVTVDSPPSVTETYENTFTSIVPSDINFCTVPIGGSYYVTANAAFDITVPPDVYSSGGSTVYAFAGATLSEVDPND